MEVWQSIGEWIGARKGVVVVVLLSLGLGYQPGSDILEHIFTTGEEVPAWAQTINDNFDEVNSRLTAIETKLGFVQGYILEDQVKKIKDNPTDVYAIDLQTIVDSIWPGIPDEAKTETLQQKYQVIEDKYNELVSNGGAG